MPVQDKPQTKVSFGTLEALLSESNKFVPEQWTQLYDTFYNKGNRAAVEFVVHHLSSQETNELVADAVALLRRRLER